MINQSSLDLMKAGVELSKRMSISDVESASADQTLDLFNRMSDTIKSLVTEVERLQRGLNAGREEIERHRKRGQDSEKDPSLSWYDTDHHHEQLFAIEQAIDEVLEEMDKGLEEK